MTKYFYVFGLGLLVTAAQANAETASQQLVCFAGLADNMVSRHVRLAPSETDANVLTGYRASRETGGYQFTAKRSGNDVLISILPDTEGAPSLVEAKATLPYADAELAVSAGVIAYVSCSEEIQ